MALSGRGNQRFSVAIWPGYVDALSTLLLVLTFVLTIFMVVQFALRDTISTQDDELDDLAAQVAGLADALGLQRAETASLQGALADAQAEGRSQAALIATLTTQLSGSEAALTESRAQITSFEAQVATLLSERDSARAAGTALEAENTALLSDKQALDLALARARDEIDAGAEAARLAAARREALDAMVADLRKNVADKDAGLAQALASLAAAQTDAEAARTGQETEALAAAALRKRLEGVEARITDEEAARLAEAAAAETLRARLANADTELTAMTLALEEQRKRAEETLTLLAAAEAARDAVSADSSAALTEAQRRAGLLAAAEQALASERQTSAEAQRQVALLNEQVAALRGQLGALQGLLDEAAARDTAAKVQIDSLGSNLNAALAQVASEQRQRAELEAAARARLEAEAAALKDEAANLARYRSDFFGKLNDVLAGQEGVRVVGDRFVFSSEVLFQPASADLSEEGRAQIARVVDILAGVAGQIPPEIDWIIRVDGHTDATPLSGRGEYADNWELSQGRALSVVRYMTENLGFDPRRLAATGFGEYRPVAEGDSPEALAANRRIEMKLTER